MAKIALIQLSEVADELSLRKLNVMLETNSKMLLSRWLDFIACRTSTHSFKYFYRKKFVKNSNSTLRVVKKTLDCASNSLLFSMWFDDAHFSSSYKLLCTR